MPSTVRENFDVLVVGAGLSGIYSLYHLRQTLPDWRIKCLEAGGEVGGTWAWNKYPGCRFDSESVSYGYSFDKELLDEWHWKEAFSPQPETLKYIKRVAEKHDLYKDIQFDTRIQSAVWDDSKRESFHTSRWPAELDVDRDFAGKRVGVIGTGATGIQLITELSKSSSIGSLTVFQRTANWSAPLRNSDITLEQMSKHREEYNTTFQRCAETPACFIHEADPRSSLDVTEEERLELWEKLYAMPGFAKWLGVFSDTYTDREANQLYSNFMADKIRQRVNDPDAADSLIPKNHGFGTRRVPLESGYFEAYNKDNVHLVDLQKTPIERVTAKGIRTSAEECKLDVLIFATGFDAITGAFSAIDWQAKGRPLIASSESGKNPIWPDHRPSTFLGLTAPGLPNTFMVLGPHQAYGNATRSIEHAVEFIGALLRHCSDNNITYVEPTTEAAEEWTEHVVACSRGALMNDVDSWMTGVNKNVKGKNVRSVARYTGSALEYRRRCKECQASGYRGLVFA